MASASSKKSLDTDYITLRKVFARQSDNIPPPGQYVLASYGDGRTYWAQPSTLGMLATFNEFQMDSNSYIGSNNSTLTFTAGTNIRFSTFSVSSFQIIGNLFQYIDVSGADSIYSFSNNQVNNRISFATSGFISTSTTVPTQTLFLLSSIRDAPALCTNIISYQSLKVISTLKTPSDTSQDEGNMIYSKQDIDSYPVLSGYKDFLFQTNAYPTVAGIQLSSYSARDFLGISTSLATSYLSTLSTISSIYTSKDIYSTALTSLSTTEYRYYSTNVSTTIGFSNETQLTYNQKFGDTMARATIIQLNDQFGLLNTGLSTVSTYKTPVYIMISANKSIIDSFSTPTSISTSTFYNFGAGSIFNFRVNGILAVSTQLSTLSTAVGTNITNYVNSLTNSHANFIVSTTSTFNQLGSIGYISSLSVQSTLQGLGTISYVSTPSLISTVSGMVQYYPNSIQVQSSFVSTTAGLDPSILSSLTLQSSIVSTVFGMQTQPAYTYISSAGLQTGIVSTTKGLFDYAGTNSYISSLTLASTLISTFSSLSLYPKEQTIFSSINSTINGLTFVSTLSLQSTLDGLTKLNYFTQNDLNSTVDSYYKVIKCFESTIVLSEDLFGQQVTMSNTFASDGSDIYTGSSNQYFSSFNFTSLAGYKPLIQTASFVNFEYTPALFFTQSPVSLTHYNNISTAIQIGSVFYHGTLFRERFMTTNSNCSNEYSRKILFTLPANDFLTAESNGFSIVHLFENFYSFGSFDMGSVVSLLTPRSNSLFISIYN